MKKGVVIVASVVGVAIGAFGIYHGIIHNEIDSGWVMAAVGFGFTASTALILYVNDSLNKRIDDLRDYIKAIDIDESLNKRIDDLRDDVKGIDQRLQNHRHR